MDDNKSEEVFQGSIPLDDFDDNSKDMNVDQKDTPTPADDFEW